MERLGREKFILASVHNHRHTMYKYIVNMIWSVDLVTIFPSNPLVGVVVRVGRYYRSLPGLYQY